jgi:hypothetical protein
MGDGWHGLGSKFVPALAGDDKGFANLAPSILHSTLQSILFDFGRICGQSITCRGHLSANKGVFTVFTLPESVAERLQQDPVNLDRNVRLSA